MGAGIIDCDCARKLVRTFILLGSGLKLLIFEQLVSWMSFRTISTKKGGPVFTEIVKTFKFLSISKFQSFFPPTVRFWPWSWCLATRHRFEDTAVTSLKYQNIVLLKRLALPIIIVCMVRYTQILPENQQTVFPRFCPPSNHNRAGTHLARTQCGPCLSLKFCLSCW